LKSITLAFLVFILQIPVNVQDDALPRELFLQQECSNTCTLSASAMMIRSCLYQRQCDYWTDVTEHNVKATAWTSEGLCWEWDYEIGGYTVSVSHRSVSGMDEEKLKTVLENNPEGIVLYCGGDTHHAVFVYAYSDGTVYCADPAQSYSGDAIALSKSLLGQRIGAQEEILHSVSAYWYIQSSQEKQDMDTATKPPAIVQNQP